MCEERKVVTVLFCDLVGSTAQAERLDPEDVRALLSHYHERVKTELERFYAEIGSLVDEAQVRLRAAEQFLGAGRGPEASEQLDRAVAFYRSVGATRYLSKADALLRMSA